MKTNQAILLLLLVFAFPALKAQQSLREKVEYNIEYFYLDEATRLLEQEEDRAYRHYYFTRIIFFKYLATENKEYANKFLTESKTSFDIVQKMPKADPMRKVLLADLYFERGVIRFIQGNYLTAGTDLQNACEAVNANHRNHPSNVEQLKLLGTFHVALSSMPKKFKWLGALLCFKGNLNTGLSYLRQASREGNLLRNESAIVLFYMEKNILGKQEAAISRIYSLYKKDPDNYVYNFLLASAYLEERKNEKAYNILRRGNEFRQDPRVFQTAYWDYFKGKSLYFKLDYARSRAAFSRFILEHKGTTFKSDAKFRIGISFALEGNYPKAKEVFAQLAARHKTNFDEDSYAWSMANVYSKRPLTPNEISLFKARNLFDGGYYAKAIKELEPIYTKKSDLREDELTELHYRLGRIYQAIGKTEEARGQYFLCIKTEPNISLWMKVYSHYYLGKLEEARGNKTRAIELYKTAMTYDNYFYQSGLEQRCKTAITQAK